RQRDVAQRISKRAQESREPGDNDYRTQARNGSAHRAAQRAGRADPESERTNRSEQTYATNSGWHSINSAITHAGFLLSGFAGKLPYKVKTTSVVGNAMASDRRC